MMWPDYCIRGSEGARYHNLLQLGKDDIEVQIGTNPASETLSAFGNKKEKTNLRQVLEKLQVRQLYFIGFAFDYCVCYSACDGAKNGFESFVIKDATLSINPDDESLVNTQYKTNGVKIINIGDL